MKYEVEESLFRAASAKTVPWVADPAPQRVLSPALWLAFPMAVASIQGARFLRFGAIAATTVAGLIPLMAEISGANGQPQISPAWASVALVLAVALGPKTSDGRTLPSRFGCPALPSPVG
jgi:hypothetical protein